MDKILEILEKSKIFELIKILICSAMLSILCISAKADDLNIQLLRDIDFKNGFGQIEAKPILKDVTKDIKIMGEFNVEEKNGNVEIKVDKILYEGKIYNLSESFSTKRRLKNPQTAKLGKNAKIKLSGGSHPEILAILNGESSSSSTATNSNIAKTNNDTSSIPNTTNNYGSSTYGNGRFRDSGSSNNYPYYYPPFSNNSSGDNGNTGANSSGSCKSPEIKDGMAYVYPKIAGICTQKVVDESALYKKQNTSTCPNKIDYDNLKVSVGEESYAIIDDTEYKIKSCEYINESINLEFSRESCSAIPNFETKTANIQKQYWYKFQNEKVNVGSCFPTGETIPIYDDDYNACEYRLDFENAKAIKQTKWYYYVENEKVELGECVDVDDTKLDSMTFNMYENAQGCECSNLNGVNYCKTKLSFNGFNNEKIDATECRFVDVEGIGLQEEFAGYEYHDTSKFALRKINQYFIGTGGEKIYVTKDKTTDKKYDYKTEACGWEHIEAKNQDGTPNTNIGGMSYHKSQIYFIDDDKNERVEVKSCEANTDLVMYWEQQLDLEKGAKTQTHKRIVMIPFEQSESATQWTMPQIKVSDQYQRDVIATTEAGQIPIWSSNFAANNLKLYEEERTEKDKGSWGNFWSGSNAGYSFWTKSFPLKLDGVDFVESDITIGYALANLFTLTNINTPFNATDTQITTSREVALDTQITLKPTSITMNENLLDEGSTEDGKIAWKTELKEVIDSNTGKCVLEECNPNPKFDDTKAESDTNKKCLNPKYDPNKETCKTQLTTIYTSGITFTPNYDNAPQVPQVCNANEVQSLDFINSTYYELPEPTAEQQKDYFNYIESIKDEAMNVNNYQTTIDKVICSSNQATIDANQNAYIIGAVINNQRKDPLLTKLEIESLANMNLTMKRDTWTTTSRNGFFGNKTTTYHTKQTLTTTFATKKNWANNQTIGEYEMYRRFKRPDGSVFRLYERQGFFVE